MNGWEFKQRRLLGCMERKMEWEEEEEEAEALA